MNVRLATHLVAQILAQGAVLEIVPPQFKPYFAALVAVVGVFVAYFDQTASQ